jgi:holo-[acyl-carrier protein] synthase
MPIRVGIDLVATDEVRESLQTHGDRYLNRIYTDLEQRDCRSDPARLAVRFAAKEATMKALGRRDEPISWRSIAVALDAAGRPSLQLTAGAAELARRRGVRRLEVSLTETRSQGAALVLAEVEDRYE